MSTTLPIWSTIKTVLSHCWRQAGLATKYAAPPLTLLFLIHVTAIALNVDMKRDLLWAFIADASAILIYAPFIVTWFQSIVSGEDQARTRPLVTFGTLEKSVIVINIQIAVVTLAAGVLLAVIAVVESYAIVQFTPLSWVSAGIIAGVPAGLLWIYLLTRVSVAVAYAAAGEPIGMMAALRLSQPIALNMTIVHIVLGLGAGIPIAALAAPLYFSGETGDLPTNLASSAVRVAGLLVYLLFVTTLYGFAYRILKGADRQSRQPEAN